MNEKNLITYYNKFNEEKRLTHRHGIVEYQTTMHYIHEVLKKFTNPIILDVGAGTGRYSIALSEEGYTVHAVELIKHNLMTLKQKNEKVKTYLRNATDLSCFPDDSFDVVLLFGPLYHLIQEEEKIKALKEAKRVVKPGGFILCSYYMNEYAILTHGFRDNYIKEAIQNKEVDSNYHITPKLEDLYSMVRIEDIDHMNKVVGLKRVKILAQDGPSDYMRSTLNKMDEETFHIFLNYHLSICERYELLGASSHVLDIVTK